VASLNAALVWLLDTTLAPVIRGAPLAALVAVSVLTGLAMLVVVRYTSNQGAVTAAKRGIYAALFEIRLFNDDLGAVFSALRRMLWQNLQYLRYSFVPFAWVALPLTLFVVQLDAFYGYEGLTVGQSTLLTVRLQENTAPATLEAGEYSLEPSGGIRVETPAIVFPGAREVSWRIVPTAPGDFTLTPRVGQMALAKRVHVSNDVARRSQARVAPGLVDQLLYPSEPPVPDSGGVTEIALAYTAPGLDVLGWRMHWMVLYVAISMLTAFAFAKRFGVTL
jgi:hypothetical protein